MAGGEQRETEMEDSSPRDQRKRADATAALLEEASSKRRKLSFFSAEEDSELLLASPPSHSELRSRTVLSSFRLSAVIPTLHAAEFCSGDSSRSSSCSCHVDALSRFSSSHLEEELHVAGDPEVKNFETETSTCINNANFVFSRENSPSSSIENTMSTTMQKTSPEKPKVESGLRRSTKMPPQAEIEEFFSAAEKYEQKRFMEKYNYDIVKDVPLEGRYQWVRLKREI